MKSLHIIPHTRPSGINRELDLLLTAPPTASNDHRVYCLDRRHCLDLRQFWTMRTLIKEFQPDQITAWGPSALRAALLTMPRRGTAIVVRKPIPATCRTLSRWERWLLGRADRYFVSSQAEFARCQAAGLPAGKLRLVAPGVRPGPKANSENKPHIVSAGALEQHKGFYEAVWAFDILHFPDNMVELTIAGEGPQRPRLEAFATQANLRVRLPGVVPDPSSLFAQATLAWVPSLTDSGAGVALEAMAAGLPVIASRIGALAEIVVDGTTGILVEPGNQMELATKTRRLLLDPKLCRQMGEAGRRRATELYSPGAFVSAWMRACEDVAIESPGCFSAGNAIPFKTALLPAGSARKSA